MRGRRGGRKEGKRGMEEGRNGGVDAHMVVSTRGGREGGNMRKDKDTHSNVCGAFFSMRCRFASSPVEDIFVNAMSASNWSKLSGASHSRRSTEIASKMYWFFSIVGLVEIMIFASAWAAFWKVGEFHLCWCLCCSTCSSLRAQRRKGA